MKEIDGETLVDEVDRMTIRRSRAEEAGYESSVLNREAIGSNQPDQIRSRNFYCGHCGETISYITWYFEHVSDRTGAWIHERRRGWVHDWNGSLNSDEGGHHTAWRGAKPSVARSRADEPNYAAASSPPPGGVSHELTPPLSLLQGNNAACERA